MSDYAVVVLPPIPIGPEGVFKRILLRTPKQPWWMDRAKVAVALRSYGRKRRRA